MSKLDDPPDRPASIVTGRTEVVHVARGHIDGEEFEDAGHHRFYCVVAAFAAGRADGTSIST